MKKVYIVLFQYRLSDHYVTDKRNAIERCEFVSRITNRHLTDSTFILDYTNKSIKKSRTNEMSYNDFYSYLKTQFPDEIQKLEAEFNGE